MQEHCHSRCEMLDAAKGIGIIFVFLGHLVVYDSPLFRAIFNFHMPLFFFISGCFFRRDPEGGARNYFARMLKNIGLPLLFFTLLAAVVALFNPPAEIPHKDTYPYWLVYCVSTWHSGPVFVRNVWFLVCLAVTQGVAWLVWPWCRRSISRLLALFAASIAAACGIATLDTHYVHLFPIMTSSMPMALVFYLLGNLCRGKINVLEQCHRNIALLPTMLALLVIEIVFAVFLCETSPNLAIPAFPSIGTFAVASTSGIAAMLLSGKLLNNGVLRFLGRNSLYLFMLEGYASGITLWLLRRFGMSLPDNPLADVTSASGTAAWLVVSLVVAALFACLARPVLAFLQQKTSRKLRI